jgi:exodeoxyribonuclease VIII
MSSDIFSNIMVDIETLGTDNNSLILSISAVEFDLISGRTGREFEIGINLDDQIANGAIVDVATCIWWFKQDEAAVKALFRLPRISLKKALYDFNFWLDECKTKNSDIKLWGNGVSFDNVIIRNLYKRANVEFVLPYWCDTDVRTLVTLGNIDTRNFAFNGIKHRGIDDCKHQIKYCAAAYKAL